MKAIMISIKPKYVADILNGRKTIEIRKTMPKCDLPIDVYIYCTKDKKYANLINRGGFLTGMVVAKFTLNKVEEISYFDELQIPDGYEDYDGNWVDTSKYEKDLHWITNGILKQSCLSYDELHKYLGKKTGYAWHIDNLVIFDKPKELSEFRYATCPQTNCEYCKYNKTVEGDLYCTRKPLTKAPQSYCFIETGDK